MFKYLAENRLSPSNLSKHIAVKQWEIKLSCETGELCYLRHTGGELRLRETEQVPRRTSQLLSRWLLAQPVIPGTAGLVWQNTVPGQAGLRSCGRQWKGLPGAPGTALSEVCQSDLCNVAELPGKAENCSWDTAQQKKSSHCFNCCVLEMQNWNTGQWWLGQNHAEDLWSLLDVNPALLIPKSSFGPQDHHSSSAELVDVNHCGALATARSQVLPWNQWFSLVLL